ncbi:hypothetical protein HDV57DRAFT_508502 [Trichoderma longibrachiatum]|uniref:F-box domain-containing protein n=1 Tax=Trichoderma longibrachiatum ATCC 18648 TaxID=983965 RepID=A0A2T4C493_TRILO|nr:hypothetical protein M440DRAFT_1377435 [Trichoderma longibrachiatum ATCC 18648]
MAVVAMVTSGDRRIYALPGQLADVEKIFGGEYGSEEDEDGESSSCLTDVFWYFASLNRELLTSMLKQGGWWSSMLSILSPMRRAPASSLSREAIMSKWIARECSLLGEQQHRQQHRPAFVEVGHTDFSAAVPGCVPGDLHGAMSFTVSLCGRFLMAVHGRVVYIYELNHVCFPERLRWALPIRRRQGMPLGLLRPVTRILCPRRVISCSMDASAERYSVAFLMEGRVGMVCDIMVERTGTSSPSTPWTDEGAAAGEYGADASFASNFDVASSSASASASASASSSASAASSSASCVCQDRLPCLPLPLEEGPRSVYRNVCHPDDPPRSVAICPQRKCVAFGCSAGIELHWVDAMTGQDLSRWFPLTSPSDFLYFLPPRRGVDTPRKLRLISSAAGLGGPMDLLEGLVHGFSTSLLGTGSSAMVSCLDADSWYLRHGRDIYLEASGSNSRANENDDGHLLSRNVPRDSPLRRLVAASVDHFRAVPLSDGYHILFTDPRTGSLCLGTDAPVGSLTRLLRKLWFRPPPQAHSPVPLLYTAGADTRHGVRVVATFAAARRGDEETDQQLIVFYTVPPDMFHDIRRTDGEARSAGYRPRDDHGFGRPESRYGVVDLLNDPFGDDRPYPVEIHGHVVAVCGNLTEIALNSSPDLVIWAFAAEGWAKAWALNTGRYGRPFRTSAQRDGSIRQVDADGDVLMTERAHPGGQSLGLTSLDFNLFDGAHVGDFEDEDPPMAQGPYCWGKKCHVRGQIWEMQDDVADALSIDMIEEVGSITRVNVELMS